MATIREIEYFIAACEYGSLKKAATEKFISQQAISKAVRALEVETDCKLLRRTSVGVEPTSAGRYVLEVFKRVDDNLRCMLEYLKSTNGVVEEKLNILMAYGVNSTMDSGLISTFRAQHPNIHVSIVDAPDYSVEAELSAGKAEVAFLIEPVDRSEFDTYPLYSFDNYLYLHKDNPLNNLAEITFPALRNQDFIGVGPLFKSYRGLIDSCEQAGFTPNYKFICNEVAVVMDMAKNNQGILVIPNPDNNLASPDMRLALFPDSDYRWSVSLATKKGRVETHATQIFREFMIAAFE
jgi:DNA-binding transcriptional LysR family regulator